MLQDNTSRGYSRRGQIYGRAPKRTNKTTSFILRYWNSFGFFEHLNVRKQGQKEKSCKLTAFESSQIDQRLES